MCMNVQADTKLNELKCVIEHSFSKFLTHACIQLGCKETAKDIVQESFLAAYQKLHSFEGKSSLETWIFGILNNKILEHYRKKENEKKHIDFNIEEVLFKRNGQWKKEWMENSLVEKEDTEEKNRILNFLKQCFSKLTEHYQKVFALKFFAEKNTREICGICSCSEDNVWQILHRGKLQLKACIQSEMKKQND